LEKGSLSSLMEVAGIPDETQATGAVPIPGLLLDTPINLVEDDVLVQHPSDISLPEDLLDGVLDFQFERIEKIMVSQNLYTS